MTEAGGGEESESVTRHGSGQGQGSVGINRTA